MRRLAIDPGSKRVGLAWSDGETAIALPLKTLDADDRKRLLDQLRLEIAELDVGEVIIGLPLRMDGTEGEASRRSRELAAQLEQATGVRVVLWDERLTTVSAQRALRSAGIEERHQRDKVDRAAATILLQSYLDSHTETPWDVDPMPAGAERHGSRRRRNGSRGR